MSRSAALYEVVRLSRPIVLNSARVVEAGLDDKRITLGMRAVLELLHDSGPLSVPQIARRLDIARQGVQRIVNDLETGASIARWPNPDHKRSPLYALTDAGRTLFEHVHADELAELDDVAQRLPDDDIAAALRVLKAVDEALRTRTRTGDDRR